MTGISPSYRVAAFLIGLLAVTSTPDAAAQQNRATIESLIERVERDSLLSYARTLTGLDLVSVDDSVLVYQRDSLGAIRGSWYVDTLVSLSQRYEVGNEVAAYWIKQKLQSFGFSRVEIAPLEDRPWIQNVIAHKRGSADPRTDLIGAHYDTVLRAPGADDNASGTAAVLEAARLLSDVETVTTILFAFWDAEESGLVGSEVFAAESYEYYPYLEHVVNLDMIGWDGDGDRVIEIHSDTPSFALAQAVESLARDLQIGVEPVVFNPGTRRSDHASFWKFNIPGILLIEEAYGGDFNPHYHSPADSLGNVDADYMTEATKLGVAAIAELALVGTPVSATRELPDSGTPLTVATYPNPFAGSTRITVSGAPRSRFLFRIFDVVGRLVDEVSVESGFSGVAEWTWSPPGRLSDGVYFYHAAASGRVSSGLMVRARF
jgi:hypothetical protein